MFALIIIGGLFMGIITTIFYIILSKIFQTYDFLIIYIGWGFVSAIIFYSFFSCLTQVEFSKICNNINLESIVNPTFGFDATAECVLVDTQLINNSDGSYSEIAKYKTVGIARLW